MRLRQRLARRRTADVATQFRMQQVALKFVAEYRDRASRDKAAGEPRHSSNIGDLVWARHPKKLHDVFLSSLLWPIRCRQKK
jgi:hypothetical protein